MRLLAIVVVVVGVILGCTNGTAGTAVANPQRPQDVWQLAGRLTSSVPLTIDKMESILGTSLSQDSQNPRRWQSGTVRMSESLSISSSVTGIDDGAWLFAAVDVEPQPCITVDMVKEHYPSMQLKSLPTGHSLEEKFVWVVSYSWGELGFGIREKDNCLSTVSLDPSSGPEE